MNINTIDLTPDEAKAILADGRLILAAREELEAGQAAIAERDQLRAEVERLRGRISALVDGNVYPTTREAQLEHYQRLLAALSDPPPPNPRDAALLLATQALEMASGTFNAYTVHHAAKRDEVKQAKNQCLRDQMDAAITAIQAATEPARQSPTDPRDEALDQAEAELLRLWKLVPAGCAGVGGVRTIALEDGEVARLRQIVDAIRAAWESQR